MSTRVEQIVKQLADWSPDELRELKAWMEGELAAAEAKDKRAAIDRIFGKYAHVSTSAEDFCARKAADLELESHSPR